MSRGRWVGMVALLLAAATAGARPVAIGGVVQSAAVGSRVVAGTEALAVWTLPRLGVAVRNDARDLRLLYGERELRFSPERGWRAVGFTPPLDVPLGVPQLVGGSLYVPLTVVRALGVRIIADAPDILDFAAPPAVPVATLPPSPDAPVVAPTAPAPAPTPPARPTASRPEPAAPPRPPARPVTPAPVPTAPAVPAPPATRPPEPVPAPPPPAVTPPVVSPPPAPTPPSPLAKLANLDTVRVSRTLHRTVEVQRVVLELSGEAPHQVVREGSGLSVVLAGVTSSGSTQRLESGDSLSVEPGVVSSSAGTRTAQTTVRLKTGGGVSEIFTLEDPPRVVIDTTTHMDPRVPPPIDPEGLPEGVTYRARGPLHLLSFDPARFQPRVVTAPVGAARDVAALVKGVGGVAGVNGGYFDPASHLPVDLVAVGGLMTAPSLERRATVGFTAQGGTFFGYPRPRYVLGGAFGSVTVNTVGAKVRPELLTAFVGDGRTAVGASGLTTLYLAPGGSAVAGVVPGRNVPPGGTLAFTFDAARFPHLPRGAGDRLSLALNWQATDAPWPSAQDALSAGPLLVRGGQVVLNPAREQFDTGAGVWRPTRQVAFGVMAGQPTIAYLEHGTPEAFAAALAAAGVRDAVRLDSGSSATAYLTGGYAGLGGYLNTVWSRPVPNAIVFVPRGSAAASAARP